MRNSYVTLMKRSGHEDSPITTMSGQIQSSSSSQSLEPNLTISDTGSSSPPDAEATRMGSVHTTPFSEDSHSTASHKLHVIAATVSLMLFLVLLLAFLILYKRYKNLKELCQENGTRTNLSNCEQANGSFAQIEDDIVGRWKHGGPEGELPAKLRTKVPFQIQTESRKLQSRRSTSPHPLNYSYHNTDEHSSLSGSSTSSFDGISPLDATIYPFFPSPNARKSTGFSNSPHVSRFAERASLEAYTKGLHGRQVHDREHYQLRPIQLNDLGCPAPNTLEDLDMFVSRVEHKSDPVALTSQGSAHKDQIDPKSVKKEISESVTIPKNSESSADRTTEKRNSMLGRGESYYWKTPARTNKS